MEQTKTSDVHHGFSLQDIPIVAAFLDFEIAKNEHDIVAWKNKTLWFNATGFPGNFKKRVKSLKEVREIVRFYEDVKTASENTKKYGFTEKPSER